MRLMDLKYDDQTQDLLIRALGLMLRTDLLSLLNGAEDDRAFLLYNPPTSAGRAQLLRLVRLLKAVDDGRPIANPELEEVNKTLEACTVHPHISKTSAGKLAVDDRVTRDSSNSAHAAMRALVYLIREGRLALLNECECGRWFLAKRRGQESCTQQCYLRRYQSTEAVKTKRREYDEGVRTGKFIPQAKRAGKIKGGKNAKA